MPKAFIDCQKKGGKIITKKLPKGKYMHICYDKDGNAHPGEIKTKKSTSEILSLINEVLQKIT